MRTISVIFVMVMLITTAFGQYSIELEQIGTGLTQKVQFIVHNNYPWIVSGSLFNHPQGAYTMFKSLDYEYEYIYNPPNNSYFMDSFLPNYETEKSGRDHLFRLHLMGTGGGGQGKVKYVRQ